LLNLLSADHVHAYLSGLLIGNEIKEALASKCTSAQETLPPILLVGSDTLCDRYQLALEILKVNAIRTHSTTTANAFAKMHQADNQ